MSQNRNDNWFFVATSGATTDNLTHTQRKDYDIDGKKGSRYIDKQLDVFKELGDKKAEYVTVSIGGNDAQFTDVITKAALSFSFNPGLLTDKLDSVWEEFYYGIDGGESMIDFIKLIAIFKMLQVHKLKLLLPDTPNYWTLTEADSCLMREMLLSLMIR